MGPQNDYRVYVDGIWDLFHSGHEQLMYKALAKATEKAGARPVKLVVGVCGSGVAEYKRKTIMDLDERSAAVRAHHLAPEVIKDCPIRLDGDFLNQNGIDLVVHGNDFTEDKKRYYYGAALDQNKYAEVPYSQGISTTDLLRDAKTESRFRIPMRIKLLREDGSQSELSEEMLIARIRERTWEDLRIQPQAELK